MTSGPPFRQTRIPADLADEILRLLRENPFLGHRTLADFVRVAAADRLRFAHLQLAMRSLWLTTDLGADAVDALLRDSLPPDYQALLESERRRQVRA